MAHFATAFAALLLFALLPASESARPRKLPPIAVDSNGAQLRPGVEYYAVLANGNKGFLDLSPAHPKAPCPMDVVQGLSPEAAKIGGLPFIFSQLNPNDTSPIRTSTDISVAFAVVNMCVQSSVWKLGKFEDRIGKWYLTTGGTLGKPGVATLSSWFKLEKVNTVANHAGTAPAVYKVVFCPHVCRYCKVVCGDIGVVGGDSQKRKLGISNVPLLLSFRKA